ncbi:MAG: LuxR C-terminal-related transcriptional regulator [Polyangiales bacterium]
MRTVIFLEMDREEHERLTAAVSPQFTPIAVESVAATPTSVRNVTAVIASLPSDSARLEAYCAFRSKIAPSRPLAVLSDPLSSHAHAAALDAGADAVLVRPIAANVFVATLRAFARTQTSDPSSIEHQLRQRSDQLAADACLSLREREVLDLLLLGRSLNDIALVLGISPRTAKFHQANVLAKLGADSRFDLMRLLIQ